VDRDEKGTMHERVLPAEERDHEVGAGHHQEEGREDTSEDRRDPGAPLEDHVVQVGPRHL